MSKIQEIEGKLDGTGKRFGIVASRFNSRVVELLIEGAVDCFARHGVRHEDIQIVRVPGAWEVPQALEELAAASGPDGLVAAGVLIRGETPHFDHLCAQASSGVARVAAQYRIPVAFGILTCETPEQAQERAGGKSGNKGWEAALAALEMVDLYSQLRSQKPAARVREAPVG